MNLIPDGFMPHGHCYQWRADILSVTLAGHAGHVIAYMAISGMLFFAITRRFEPHNEWMRPLCLLFAVFIFTCGVDHLLGIFEIWYPIYQLSALWKMLSGAVSLFTLAILLIRRRFILESFSMGPSQFFAVSSDYSQKSRCQKCLEALDKAENDC